MNILLVDDSEIVRAVLEKTLHLAKVPLDTVFHAANGKEALELIVEHDEIDVIFADINMPVMNGVEMIDRLANYGLLPDVPVVVISSDGSQKRLEYLKEKGIRGFIRKPFHPEQVSRMINEIQGNNG